jgi:hypothetical protein
LQTLDHTNNFPFCREHTKQNWNTTKENFGSAQKGLLEQKEDVKGPITNHLQLKQ